MSPSTNHEWVTLRDFDDPVLAGDVITSILSMEFEAILVDLSSNSIVAGGTGVESATDDPATDEPAAKPFELRSSLGGYDPVLGMVLPFEQSPTADVDGGVRWDSESGGPWRLMVPNDLHEELEPIIHVIIDEQKKFDADHDELKRNQIRISRFILTLIMLFVLILALRFIGVL